MHLLVLGLLASLKILLHSVLEIIESLYGCRLANYKHLKSVFVDAFEQAISNNYGCDYSL